MSDPYQQAKHVAFGYLSYRPRSVRELSYHLQRKKFPESICEQVVVEMIEQGYLDDQSYARIWSEERRQRKMGERRVMQELMSKGIARDVIVDALAETEDGGEYERAREAAELRHARMLQEPWPKVKRRLSQYLQRRGFRMDVVVPVLEVIYARHHGGDDDH